MPLTEEEKKQKEKSKLAQRELNELEQNDSTAALASLPDMIAFQEQQANIIGSGEDRKELAKEARKKKKEAAKKKAEAAKKKKEEAEKKKKAEEEEKKRKEEEKKKKIDETFQKMKTTHGGLNGTEDTGYDDDLMANYIKEPINVMINDDQFSP